MDQTALHFKGLKLTILYLLGVVLLYPKSLWTQYFINCLGRISPNLKVLMLLGTKMDLF